MKKIMDGFLVCASFFPQTALELNGVLNSCKKRSLFHHDLLFLLVPARVPVLVSLSSLFFLFSGKGFCSIMMSWLCVVPALVLVSLLLSSFLSQEMEFVPSWSWFLLVPARVPVLVSLLLSSCFSQE